VAAAVALAVAVTTATSTNIQFARRQAGLKPTTFLFFISFKTININFVLSLIQIYRDYGRY
jgi:hypothetical protein